MVSSREKERALADSSIAYIHTLMSLRLPSLSPEHLLQQDISPSELTKEFADLLPWLFDPTSTVRYESARSAWAAVWEAIGRLDGAQDPKTLVFLLDVVARLLHPPIVTDPPRAVGVLDDLYAFLSTRGAKGTPAGAAKKLLFYIAAMRQLGRESWLAVEREVERETEALKAEGGDVAEATGGDGERAVPLVTPETTAGPRGSAGGARIELLD